MLPCRCRCRLATFYSRSRKGRWCKGETSGHFIKVRLAVGVQQPELGPQQRRAAAGAATANAAAAAHAAAARANAPPVLRRPAMQVLSSYMDCDRDSLIYLSEPIGPACHTNAPTCYFQQARGCWGPCQMAGLGFVGKQLVKAQPCR